MNSYSCDLGNTTWIVNNKASPVVLQFLCYLSDKDTTNGDEDGIPQFLVTLAIKVEGGQSQKVSTVPVIPRTESHS